MSRPPGWMPASVTRFWRLCAQAHRAAGGMIIASTHTPLDLPGTEVLSL